MSLMITGVAVFGGLIGYADFHRTPQIQRQIAADVHDRYNAVVDSDQVGLLPIRYGATATHVVVTVGGAPQSCSVERNRTTKVLVFCGTGSTELPVVGGH